METFKKALLVIVFLSIFVWIYFKYSQPNKSPANTTKYKVAASIFPIYDIVKNVAGSNIDVVLIAPIGASPHTYDPKPDDIKNIDGSSAVFTIGHNLDNYASKIAKSLEIEIVTLDKYIKLKDSIQSHSHDEDHAETDIEKESVDPHYWLSLSNGILIAKQVNEELSKNFPEFSEEFDKNFKEYEKRLLALERENQIKILPFKNTAIATFHDAWAYFADSYNLKIVTTFEEFPGQEPSPEYLKNFTYEIKEHNVKYIFSEPQFSTKALNPIANDLGLTISQLDPIGGNDEVETFESLIQYNLNQIIKSINK